MTRPVVAHDLRAEYTATPANLDPERAPRLGWTVGASGRGARQSAYRVRVATDPDPVGSEAIVWDSGQVATTRSTAVAYGGPPLAPDTTYHWAVRLWNEAGDAGPWSDTATFTTGLAPDDWAGDWISYEAADDRRADAPFDDRDPNPLLRRSFDLAGPVASARLHVAASGVVEPYCNGERVGTGVLEPGVTQLQETVHYATVDVGEHLTAGENVLGVALGDGRPGDDNLRTSPTWSADAPVVLAQLTVTGADGTTRTVVTDERWQGAAGPTRWDSFRPGQEYYDARRERPGWADTGFDDTDWGPVSVAEGPPGTLTPRRLQPMAAVRTVTPDERSEPAPGVYVVDLGEMVAGYPRVTVDGAAGSAVELRCGERLADDGTVSEITFDGAAHNEWVYVADGTGPATWSPRFTYGGFRYVQVTAAAGEPTIEDIAGVVVHTTVEANDTGAFACSNDLVEGIHENTRRAMLNCLHGIHEDTPTWEKLGWTETHHEMAGSLSANFSMTRFWEKFLQDVRDSQLPDGDLPYVVPHDGIPFDNMVEGPGARNDPGWDGALVLVAWHAYRWTGDRRILDDHYAAMTDYVDFVAGAADGPLVETGLGDWARPTELDDEGPGIVSTATFYRCADIVAETARLLGHHDDAERYAALASDIRTAFNEAFYDPDRQVYETGAVDGYRQTSNLYPLAFDIVREENRDAVVENLVEQIRDGGYNPRVGAHGLRHLCPVLSAHGYHDVAYEVVTQRDYPSWGHWLEHGVTGLLEYWQLDARSRTHDFLGSVDEWFVQYLAGIREPLTAGFERARVKPLVPADLEGASATVDTVRGPLSSSWRQTDTGLELDVTVPGNTTVELWLPAAERARVREGGTRPAEDATGVTQLRSTADAVVYELGSGTYSFAANDGPVDRTAPAGRDTTPGD
jgi:alpha-L-rhamnosidase